MAQLFDVIFSDLRSSKRNLNRLLSAGIIFALVGHFYVVEPYFEYKAQERKAKRTLETGRENLEGLSNRLKRIAGVQRNAENGLSRIRNRIRDYPDHLRQKLGEIDRAVSAPPSLSRQQSARSRVGEFVLPAQVRTFEEGVRWYMETWFTDLLADLRRSVVMPVLQLLEVPLSSGKSDLERTAERVLTNFRAYLDRVDREKPDFWRSYEGGKVEVAAELERLLENSFRPLEGEVTGLLQGTEDALREQGRVVKAAEEELKGTQERRNELESRLNSLESPLGRIPLGLTDLIVLFPLLVLVFVVTFTVALKKTAHLYAALWREFVAGQQNPDSTKFRQFTDCWFLPPYTSRAQPVLLLACLGISAGVFMRSSWLAMERPELFGSLVSELNSFRWGFFAFAYALGVIVVVSCAWVALRVLRDLERTRVGQSPQS